MRSYVSLEQFQCSKDDDEKKTSRIGEFCGFGGPSSGSDPETKNAIQAIDGDDPDADLVILDDSGNGFRDNRDSWPQAIKTSGKKPIVILKVYRPLLEWPFVEGTYKEPCR